MTTVTYEPVGRCIYCGAVENDLRKEHIIPRGLKGIHVLPKASCKKCEAITGQIEQICLRHMLGKFRRRAGFRTKKPKEQPATLPLTIIKLGGERETKEVPVSDLPYSLSLPVLPHPGILLGNEPSADLTLKAWCWGKDMKTEIKKHGGIGLEMGMIQPSAFMRMLAKIAHAHVVATSGLSAFRPLLTDFILNGSETPGHLVGGFPEVPPWEKALHRLTVHIQKAGGTKYVVVDLRLLAQLGAPVYQIVVGEP